jgi:hypothetical protein
VYKNTSDANVVLRDTKVIQTIVNQTMKKNVKWVGFGESDEEEKLDPETPEAIHKAEMEDGGFTIVKEGDDNMVSKKSKVADGVNTTMLGISHEEA